MTIMATTTTTVTSKMQVTIPEEVRKLYPIKAGTQLAWSVEGDALVARRVRSVAQLAGCLKSDVSSLDGDQEKRAIAALRTQQHARKFRTT